MADGRQRLATLVYRILGLDELRLQLGLFVAQALDKRGRRLQLLLGVFELDRLGIQIVLRFTKRSRGAGKGTKQLLLL